MNAHITGKLRRGIYLLPSLFTMANLTLGFLAIVLVMQGSFSAAAWAIVACHFCDVLDGRVARMTNTTSSFGVEFDSFADWISFGIAPALMMHQLVLAHYGKIGFAIAALFVITGALRLARYNLKAFEQRDQPAASFVGLPIPAAGGALAAFVLVYEMFNREVTAKTIPLVMNNMSALYKSIPLCMFFLSLAMVSQIKWNNFRQFTFLRPKSLRLLMIVVVFGLLMYAYPQNIIFLMYMAYILWGLAGYVVRAYRMKKRGEVNGTEQSYNI